MAQIRNLSLAQVKKEAAEKYKNTTVLTFENGTKIDVDLVLRPSKITKLKTELIDVLSDAMEQKKKLDAPTLFAIQTMLVVKYFTSIKADVKGYDGLLDMLYTLNDGNYTNKILESFDPAQLGIVYKDIDETLKLINHAIEEKLNEINNTEASSSKPEGPAVTKRGKKNA
ncbi:hypothetical protein MH117_03080 [Paenibacillus sp. ACRRX]|uniref:hypothetical protein n=1 Tax=unclassified Paenibacillus TaxID=185978 RepID=UPI001EF3E9B3|nr:MULTISPECIES: hypothetical protein [unclassified Paenibacillus]MCG7406386.1 hypothetical protein [Paenibacillus sp. ACRRX]MDK8179416.1 hypothetical protein [Paenibacillus sp. UMB4589-SE434]